MSATREVGSAARRRGFETIGDMTRSIGLVLVAVAFVVTIVNGARPEPDPVRTVDWSGAAARAAQQAPFVPLRPAELEGGWRATSARLSAVGAVSVWELGFVTPGGDYVGLDQVGGPRAAVDDHVGELLAGYRADGTATIDGVTWDRYVEQEAPADRALARALGRDEAVVLVSTGGEALLEEFAARLR